MKLPIKFRKTIANSDIAHIEYGALFAALRYFGHLSFFGKFGIIFYCDGDLDELQQAIQRKSREALRPAVLEAYKEVVWWNEKESE